MVFFIEYCFKLNVVQNAHCYLLFFIWMQVLKFNALLNCDNIVKILSNVEILTF